MTADPVPLLRRPHTILGVCEAIGEDFGFNPLYLRVVFAAGLFFNAALMIGLYFGLGGVVALSRWLAPVPVVETADAEQTTVAVNEQAELKIAA